MIEVEEVCNYNFIKLNIKFFERLNFHVTKSGRFDSLRIHFT